jgi:hypothetical protein
MKGPICCVIKSDLDEVFKSHLLSKFTLFFRCWHGNFCPPNILVVVSRTAVPSFYSFWNLLLCLICAHSYTFLHSFLENLYIIILERLYLIWGSSFLKFSSISLLRFVAINHLKIVCKADLLHRKIICARQ